DYSCTKNPNPTAEGASQMRLGHQIARARGPLLVGLGDGDEGARLKQARIWAGGRSKIDRTFSLILNEKEQRAAMAQRIAQRINEVFHGPLIGDMHELAVAKNHQIVNLEVPHQYRHNVPRYLRVVRLIPLQDATDNGAYRHRLEE